MRSRCVLPLFALLPLAASAAQSKKMQALVIVATRIDPSIAVLIQEKLGTRGAYTLTATQMSNSSQGVWKVEVTWARRAKKPSVVTNGEPPVALDKDRAAQWLRGCSALDKKSRLPLPLWVTMFDDGSPAYLHVHSLSYRPKSDYFVRLHPGNKKPDLVQGSQLSGLIADMTVVIATVAADDLAKADQALTKAQISHGADGSDRFGIRVSVDDEEKALAVLQADAKAKGYAVEPRKRRQPRFGAGSA